MTNTIRISIYAINNKHNTKLRTFLFILQRQRIYPNFMRDLVRTFIHVIDKGVNLKTRIFSFIIQRQRNTAFIHTKLRAGNTKVRIL